MKTINFTLPNNLSLLHDQLLAAIPKLRPVPDANGDLEPVIAVEGDTTTVRLTVPDATDELAIAAVVTAHDHTMTQPDPAAGRKIRIAELLAIPRSDWTAAQQREAIELALRELTR
ncbi:MAG: hypothetical protein HQ475_07800 [SAR202 cluster bacterium]|nr:hypothetical protein [SAR202 cluster bacterium]